MKTALIVDDEQLVVMGLSRTIRKEGFTVQGVGSAEEALAYLAKNSCTFCFLDIRLPGMDGLQALPLIREEYPDMVVTVMTANALSDEQEQAIAELSHHFIRKPFDISEIRSILASPAPTVSSES